MTRQKVVRKLRDTTKRRKKNDQFLMMDAVNLDRTKFGTCEIDDVT